MTSNLQIHFSKHTFGGESLGKAPDGRMVFAPFVLPGETAEVTPYFEKKGYIKALPGEVIVQSENRITPPCPYFGACGGCQYQHIDYREQLKVKMTIVADQFERIAGIKNPPLREIIAAVEPFYYRNTVQLQVDVDGKLGYFHYNGRYVIPVDDCLLPLTEILQLWKQLDLEKFPGLKRVQFRQGAGDEQMIVLESQDFQKMPELEVDLPVSVVHSSPAGSIVLAGDDHLVFEIKQKLFKVSAASFFQINTGQAEKMANLILEFLPARGKSCLELYCGVGLFTAFYAERFDRILAVEESESACQDFAVNLNEYDHIDLYMGPVQDVLPGVQEEFDCVLLDPPRTGLDPKSLDLLLKMKIPNIVYVSCDVATLARDVKKFVAAGYRLVEVAPIDMFPQTYHVETVVLITGVKE